MSENAEAKPKRKMIAIDLDGTLLTKDKKITEGNLAAIRKAMDAGVFVCIATGRAWPGARAFAAEVKPNCPVITSNGAMIVDPGTEQVIFERCLFKKDAEFIFALGEEQGITQIVWCGTRLYASKINELSDDYSRRFGKIPAVKIDSLDDLGDTEVLKILWYIPGGKADDMRPAVPAERLSEVTIVTSDPNFLEFFSNRVSKAEAIRLIAKRCGIRTDEAAAIGDACNDLPMLKETGFGIAMGNAAEEVKENVDAITDDNEHDGVAKAIEEYVL